MALAPRDLRVLVLRSLQERVVMAAHSDPLMGAHLGLTKTLHRVATYFAWKSNVSLWSLWCIPASAAKPLRLIKENAAQSDKYAVIFHLLFCPFSANLCNTGG